MIVNSKTSSQLPVPSSQFPVPSSQFPVISAKLSVPGTAGQKCVHDFRFLNIRAVVIPGEDPESRVRFDTLDSHSPLPAFAGTSLRGQVCGNDIGGLRRLSLQCTFSKHQVSSFEFPVPSVQVHWDLPPYMISTSGRDP